MIDKNFKHDAICQHLDGGFYRYKGVARHATFKGKLDANTGIPLGATFVANAKHSEDQSAIVVFKMPGVDTLSYLFGSGPHIDERGDLTIYEHLWPFTESTWGRPVHEFAGRFKTVNLAALVQAKEHDRVTAQVAVSTAKKNRRRSTTSEAAVHASAGLMEGLLRD